MGDKDFVKPILERKGTVHFGKASILRNLTCSLTLCDV